MFPPKSGMVTKTYAIKGDISGRGMKWERRIKARGMIVQRCRVCDYPRTTGLNLNYIERSGLK